MCGVAVMNVSRAAALPMAVSAKFCHAAAFKKVAVGSIRLNHTERDIVDIVRVAITKLGPNLIHGPPRTLKLGAGHKSSQPPARASDINAPGNRQCYRASHFFKSPGDIASRSFSVSSEISRDGPFPALSFESPLCCRNDLT